MGIPSSGTCPPPLRGSKALLGLEGGAAHGDCTPEVGGDYGNEAMGRWSHPLRRVGEHAMP